MPKSGDHFTETYVGEEMGGLDFALSTAATAVQLMPRTREVRQLARSGLISQGLQILLVDACTPPGQALFSLVWLRWARHSSHRTCSFPRVCVFAGCLHIRFWWRGNDYVSSGAEGKPARPPAQRASREPQIAHPCSIARDS